MDVTDLLAPERVIARLAVHDKDGALSRLAATAAALLGATQQAIAQALLAREALGSTGIGEGIGLPHARLEGLERPFGVVASLQRSIDFQAVDGMPVDLVFLLLSPVGGRSHLEALACASRALRDRERARNARRADNAAQLYAAITAA